jgi:hypothetical protein
MPPAIAGSLSPLPLEIEDRTLQVRLAIGVHPLVVRLMQTEGVIVTHEKFYPTRA